jgi:hypothetical protein
MFLRKTQRKKDGKTHSYWSVVENRRLDSGRVVQRHVLYLGEINSSQAAVWRKAIEVLDEDTGGPRTLALFPEDHCAAAATDAAIVRLRLSEMRLCQPRQWGACWLSGQLWRELQLDRFWSDRLPRSRKGTRWDQVLQVLACYVNRHENGTPYRHPKGTPFVAIWLKPGMFLCSPGAPVSSPQPDLPRAPRAGGVKHGRRPSRSGAQRA